MATMSSKSARISFALVLLSASGVWAQGGLGVTQVEPSIRNDLDSRGYVGVIAYTQDCELAIYPELASALKRSADRSLRLMFAPDGSNSEENQAVDRFLYRYSFVLGFSGTDANGVAVLKNVTKGHSFELKGYRVIGQCIAGERKVLDVKDALEVIGKTFPINEYYGLRAKERLELRSERGGSRLAVFGFLFDGELYASKEAADFGVSYPIIELDTRSAKLPCVEGYVVMKGLVFRGLEPTRLVMQNPEVESGYCTKRCTEAEFDRTLWTAA